MVVSTILDRNAELSFQKPVEMDKVRSKHEINYLCAHLGALCLGLNLENQWLYDLSPIYGIN